MQESASAPAASAVDARPDPPRLARQWCAPALILVACACAYGGSLDAAFVLDDHAYIESPAIRAFASAPGLVIGRPLLGLSLALNHWLGGEATWSYHLFNLVIHLLAAWTLLGLVRRTLLSEPLRTRWGHSAEALALAIALLWAVHPLNTQAVTYITQRGESLMGLFYLLTLYCVARAADAPRWLFAAAVAALLGLAAKQVMVTAPFVALLYLGFFFPHLWRARRVKLGLGLFLAGWIAATVFLFLFSNAVEAAGLAMRGPPWWQYARTQPEIVLHYLSLVLWPRSPSEKSV